MKRVNILKYIILLVGLISSTNMIASSCDTVCKYTASKKYFISGITDVTGYKWRTTGNILIVNGQISDTILVDFRNSNPGFDTIGVRAYNACDTSAEVKFVVFVQDTLAKPIVSNDTAVCQGSPFAISVSGAAGASFDWTKPNMTTSTGTSISVASSNPSPDSGIYSVTQTVNGCVSQSAAKVKVIVNTKPGKAINTTDTAQICETKTKQLLGTPSGGTWSIVSGGGSVTNPGGVYTPNMASITSNTQIKVRYTIDSNGVCPITYADTVFYINFQDTARQQTDTARICETKTKQLLGTPAGGTWAIVSGSGSVTNPGGIYTPNMAAVSSNSNIRVSYTIAANGDCPLSKFDTTFVVNHQDTARQQTDTARICETKTKQLLGTPAGGTWAIVSGSGSVTNPGGLYTPNMAAVSSNSSIRVSYTIAVNGDCPISKFDTTFIVNFQDTARQQTDTARICETMTKQLLGTPAGGTWAIVSGSGSVTNPGGLYTPNMASVSSNSNIRVSYTIAANGDCPLSKFDTTFVVNFQDTARQQTDTARICETMTKQLLGTPASGTWSMVSDTSFGSIAGNVFTPKMGAVLSNQNIKVRFTVAQNGNCPISTFDTTFVVNFQDTARQQTDPSTICESSTKTLVGTPTGGKWSLLTGKGMISGNTYLPNMALVSANDSVTIRYTVDTNGACPPKYSDISFKVQFQDTAKQQTTTASIKESQTKTLLGTPANGKWLIVKGNGSITNGIYKPNNVTKDDTVVIDYLLDSVAPCSPSKSSVLFIVSKVDDNILNPDFNVVNVNQTASGNLKTNDNISLGTTYSNNVIASSSNPSSDVPTINPNGTYTFTSSKAGVYIFSVPVCPIGDLVPNCPMTELKITVLDPTRTDNPPSVNTDLGVTKGNNPVVMNTLNNDKSGNSGSTLDPKTVTVIEQPKNGTVTVDPITGNITYTPDSGFVGTDTLRYEVCDNASPKNCQTAYQIIKVLGTNAPNTTLANDDYYSGIQQVTISGNVKLNDNDPEKHTTSVVPQNIEIPGKGKFILRANGTFEFIPFPRFVGSVSLPYVICDFGNPQVCDTATLYLLIDSVINEEFPNYFSPNNDGKNDKWELPASLFKRYKNVRVTIYNRWGNTIWRSTGTYQNDWGGTLEGGDQLVPDGVYYYLIELEDEFNIIKTGFVEIMRQ